MIFHSKETLRTILNQVSDSVQLYDIHGRILYFNGKTSDLLLYSNEELKDKNISDLFPEFSDQAKWLTLLDDLDTQKSQTHEYKIQTKFGNRYPAKVKTTAIDLDGEKSILFLFNVDFNLKSTPTTKPKSILEILETSANISEYLLNNDSYEEAINQALELLGKTIQIDRIYIFENHWKEEKEGLCCSLKYEWVNTGISKQIHNPILQNFYFERDYFLFFDPLNKGEIINLHVKNIPSVYRPSLELQSIVSMLIIPIHIKDRFWGIIEFNSCTFEREWSEDEISFLKTTANTLGMFIEKCESLKALEDLVKEKETLLSELHHRTKNNLAIISGIIDLQNGFSDNPEVLAYSDTIRERIQNIALIHEQLSSTGKFSQLSFFEYLDLLIRKLEVNYIKDKTLHKTLQIESFYITDLSQMVSVGILLNEILLNAFKHAFRNSSSPKLLIEAKKINNSIYIRIKDNGPGIKDKENIFDSNTTVGMRIIHGLLNQLRAKFTVNTNEGTEYLIQLDTLKTIDQ